MNRFTVFVRSYGEWLASAGFAVALVIFLLIMSGCTRTVEVEPAPTTPATTIVDITSTTSGFVIPAPPPFPGSGVPPAPPIVVLG